ncbi:hypothetical protein [Bradyrhizobium canariense]|uniref:Uncharacterized protein n=1 Tax=Bradyrhizobium canariense TaxID=255045 RepID=A0A1H1QFD5_9BRAD|nr:hypothetical protein [Bradyrhizobium canariense]SDS22084.1 hypothetical protein SAMN05444158_1387 [Bradyrhizobium canariense]
MSILPGPAQTTAICLSVALPFLLLCYARIPGIRGAGSRFRIGCATAVGLFAIACFALPGDRQFDDVLGGILLLATAIILSYVLWSLLAWGFTLTLLTALAQTGQPITSEQWAAAYMQGGDLSTFAHNRLKLLLGSGMVVSADGKIAVTPTGMAVVRLVKLVRFATGLG